MDKRGLSLIGLFIGIFWFVFITIFLGLAVFGFSFVNDVFDQDLEVGQVNLRDVNNDSFGKINDALVTSADTIGITLLLGMSVMMILNGFYFGRNTQVVWVVIDIFILVFIFITAVYLSQIYDLFINSSVLFQDVYVDIIPLSSRFVLNLPMIVSTLGSLIMILTYFQTRSREEELINVRGL